MRWSLKANLQPQGHSVAWLPHEWRLVGNFPSNCTVYFQRDDPSSVNWATSCADSWSSRRISGDKSWQKAWHLECSDWDFWASHAKSKDPGTDGKPLNTTGTPVVFKLQRHFTEMVPQLGHKLLGKNAQTDWYGLVSHSQPTGVGHWNKWHAFTVQGQC